MSSDISKLTPITAHAFSDDKFINVHVDARHYFAVASLHDLEGLKAANWSHDYTADAVYDAAEAGGCPQARKLADYLDLEPLSGRGAVIGFEVDIDEAEVMAWLQINRPELHEEMLAVLSDDAPELA